MIKNVDSDSEQPTPDEKLVTVATYADLGMLQIAKAMLRAHGIAASFPEEHTGNINWLVVNALGGLRVQVAEHDAEHARQLLQEVLESTEYEDVEELAGAQERFHTERGYAQEARRRNRFIGLLTLLVASPLLWIGALILRGLTQGKRGAKDSSPGS